MIWQSLLAAMTHYFLPRGNSRWRQTLSARRTIDKSKENPGIIPNLLGHPGRQEKKKNRKKMHFHKSYLHPHKMLQQKNLSSLLFPGSSVLSNQNRGMKPHWLIWGCLVTWGKADRVLVFTSSSQVSQPSYFGALCMDSPQCQLYYLENQSRTRTQHGVPLLMAST